MEPGTHPPARERLAFDEAWLESVSENSCTVKAAGSAPCNMAEYAVELIAEPSIPEPEWVRCEVVGYHFGECPPDPTPYRAGSTVPLPPGVLGVELHGSDRSERLPIIFKATD
jgi:hypothetical protein